jgi:hypothetical protein
MSCDRAKRAGRSLRLALLFLGAAVLAATPPAVAEEDDAEKAQDAGEIEAPDEAEEGWDTPEGEIDPGDEDRADEVEEDGDDPEPEAPEETDEEAEAAPGSIDETEEGDEEATWRARHQAMLQAVENGEQRVREAQSQRSKLGDRYSYGGRSREQILGEFESAGQALEKARRDLDRFYEEARRADVPPGWVREDD